MQSVRLLGKYDDDPVLSLYCSSGLSKDLVEQCVDMKHYIDQVQAVKEGKAEMQAVIRLQHLYDKKWFGQRKLNGLPREMIKEDNTYDPNWEVLDPDEAQEEVRVRLCAELHSIQLPCHTPKGGVVRWPGESRRARARDLLQSHLRSDARGDETVLYPASTSARRLARNYLRMDTLSARTWSVSTRCTQSGKGSVYGASRERTAGRKLTSGKRSEQGCRPFRARRNGVGAVVTPGRRSCPGLCYLALSGRKAGEASPFGAEDRRAQGRENALLLLVDRQVVGRDAEDEDGDGGLVGGAVGGFAARVVPLAAFALVAGREQEVAHLLVVLLPHLAADLVQRVGRVVMAVPVVAAVLARPAP